MRHNPELHNKILSLLDEMPRGRVLDVPSGPGYLLKDLKERGFTGVAGEIDKDLHSLSDLEYTQVDMSQALPFEDASFDYVTSVEGIEHIENHFFSCGRWREY